jgi:[methyl-Co(III) methanol-specific corrinoid protein]:coenzyme M methyltransferase
MSLNRRELVMNALAKGPKGVRPPAANPTSIVCHGLMDAAGVDFPQAHLDAQAMADLALAGYEIVGFDAVMPEYSVDQEAAALGCEIDWGDRDNMPTAVDTPYADFSQVEVPENLLEKPSIRVVLDAISILKKHLSGKAAIIGKVMGPWTLSYHLAGTQNFLLHVGMQEHDKVLGMLNTLVPVTIAHANAQFAAGADIVVLADHATGSLVGPYHYESLLMPLHKTVCDEVIGPLILHVCGPCGDRLNKFVETGVAAYHFEYQVGPKYAVDEVGSKIALCGAVNNPQILLKGSPEDVYRQTRECIRAGVDIICPECAIPLSTPLENLKEIVAGVRDGYPN